MKALILIRKKIKARDSLQAMRIIKKKYPFARLITYKFTKDFRYTDKKDYLNRTMDIAFVKDFRKVWE